jgi:hypothetical protein
MSNNAVSFIPNLAPLNKAPFRFFPLNPKAKTPAINAWPTEASINIEKFQTYYLNEHNIAAIPPHGYFALDIDPRHGGDQALETLQRQYGELPKTLTCNTGGGGRHYYFRYDHTKFSLRAKPFPGIDVKTSTGYLVVPPSTHESGQGYQWDDPTIEIADASAWLLRAISKTVSVKSNKNDRPTKRELHFTGNDKIPEGCRAEDLFTLASSLRGMGVTRTMLPRLLQATNAAWCEPPLSQEDTEKIAHDVSSRYLPGRKTKLAREFQEFVQSISTQSNHELHGLKEFIGICVASLRTGRQPIFQKNPSPELFYRSYTHFCAVSDFHALNKKTVLSLLKKAGLSRKSNGRRFINLTRIGEMKHDNEKFDRVE